MEGTPVYVMLPEEFWAEEMWKMKCPVVRLKKALYGHKNSGVYWQRYCDERCREAVFTKVSDNWPSVYTDGNGMLLIVYVDDMKLSGPAL